MIAGPRCPVNCGIVSQTYSSSAPMSTASDSVISQAGDVRIGGKNNSSSGRRCNSVNRYSATAQMPSPRR